MSLSKKLEIDAAVLEEAANRLENCLDFSESLGYGPSEAAPQQVSPAPAVKKDLVWIVRFGDALPEAVKREAGYFLRKLEENKVAEIPQKHRKMLRDMDGISELRLDNEGRGGAWRIYYSVEPDAVIVLDFELKKDDNTSQMTLKRLKQRLRTYREA